MKHLIVSLHDFHPGSRLAVMDQVAELEKWGVARTSILVIPHYHHGRRTCDDGDAVAWLNEREQAGDDLVLHGYYHDRSGNKGGSYFLTRLYTANEAECLDLSDGELRHRIELGRRLWEEQEWALPGFIAPGWLLPERQDKVLRQLGFEYTTRLGSFSQLQKGWRRESQSLCYSTRAAWRRSLSAFWNPALFSRLKKKDLIRLSLHPNDLNWPELKLQIQELVEMALAEGFQPITYRDYAQM
ncbi:MAG: DUF2334 domain-containing protein [Blastochloris sp.]|nr:DUF2334 domain-containing protein [Blastochloris sp.]